jgi:hypothetical protein
MFEVVQGVQGCESLRRGSERRLVRGQLVDLGCSGSRALARNIGLDLQNARAGLGSNGGGHDMVLGLALAAV